MEHTIFRLFALRQGCVQLRGCLTRQGYGGIHACWYGCIAVPKA